MIAWSSLDRVEHGWYAPVRPGSASRLRAPAVERPTFCSRLSRRLPSGPPSYPPSHDHDGDVMPHDVDAETLAWQISLVPPPPALASKLDWIPGAVVKALGFAQDLELRARVLQLLDEIILPRSASPPPGLTFVAALPLVDQLLD